MNVRRDFPSLEYVVQIFKALGDETRLSIVCLLWKEELMVQELAQHLDTSPSNISHHLRLLRMLRLVKSQRQGRKVLYSLDDEHVADILRTAFLHGSHD